MQPQITHNAPQSRYEAHIDGELAGFAEYTIAGGTQIFSHTEVFDRFEGKGVGGAIARFALDDVRAQNKLRVVPQCSFIESWIERHPEYGDLVDSSTSSAAPPA